MILHIQEVRRFMLRYNQTAHNILLGYIPDENNIILLYVSSPGHFYKHHIEIFFFSHREKEKELYNTHGRDIIFINEMDSLDYNNLYPEDYYANIMLDKIFVTNDNFYLLDNKYCKIYQKEINDFLHKIISEYPDNFKETEFIYFDKLEHIFTYGIDKIIQTCLLGFSDNKFTLYKKTKILSGTNYYCKTFSISDIRKSINGKLYFNKYIDISLWQGNLQSSSCIYIPEFSLFSSAAKCKNYELCTVKNNMIMKKDINIVSGIPVINIYSDITDFIKKCIDTSFKEEKFYNIYGRLFLVYNKMLYAVNCSDTLIIKINTDLISFDDKFTITIYNEGNEHNALDLLNKFINANNNIAKEFNNFILEEL